MSEDNVQYIDGENNNIFDQKNSYEEIVLRQIQRCVENLSGEEIGGSFNVKGQYIEDVRDKIINSVETLRQLLVPFIKDQQSIIDILQEIESEFNNISESVTNYNGKQVKVKDVPVSSTRELFRKYKEFKCVKYRELFGILVTLYQKNKREIEALSYE